MMVEFFPISKDFNLLPPQYNKLTSILSYTTYPNKELLFNNDLFEKFKVFNKNL